MGLMSQAIVSVVKHGQRESVSVSDESLPPHDIKLVTLNVVLSGKNWTAVEENNLPVSSHI